MSDISDICDISERELEEFFIDTGRVVQEVQTEKLTVAVNSAIAGTTASQLTNSVEFWKWMGQNYPNTLGSPGDIAANAEGIRKLVQGKGYEWDYMLHSRNNPKNLLSVFDAGSNPSQRGLDIIKTDLFTGETTSFQNKAYASSNVPDLSTTPKDTVIITNAEKAEYAANKGYEVEPFKTGKEITADTNRRMEQAKSGTAGSYNLSGVAGKMAKAGGIAFALACSIEAVASYREWKNGEISDEEYLKKIALTGGNAAVTASVTTGIMIPVNAYITAAGFAAPFAFPIAFVVSGAVNKVVAPMFGKGEYSRLLKSAKFYQNLEYFYQDFAESLSDSSEAFRNFVINAANQAGNFERNKQADLYLSEQLVNIRESIAISNENAEAAHQERLSDATKQNEAFKEADQDMDKQLEELSESL